MTMPIPEKTWQFSPNNLKGASTVVLTDNRQLVLGIVQILTEFPINPWVVMGSSDGGATSPTGTAGMDGVNRWKPGEAWDINRLVWAAAGTAHGWIVLRQQGLFSTCDLCIDLTPATTYNITVVWGITGFTGGTTLNRPTATTSSVVINGTSIAVGSTAYGGGVLHGMQSTDGECTRLVFMYNELPVLLWIMDKVKHPSPTWAYPVVIGLMAAASTTTDVASVAFLNDTARLNGHTGALAFTMFTTGEGYGTTLYYENAALQGPNAISGEITLFPIGIVSETVGARGRHGELYDIWWGPPGVPSAAPFGTWPDDASRKFWSPSAIVLPWDGLVGSGSLPRVRW